MPGRTTRKFFHCDQCRHYWFPQGQIVLPSECPHCSSRRWNATGAGFLRLIVAGMPPVWKCLRCKWEWFTRSGERPERCGKCTSPLWDSLKPRRRKPIRRRAA